MKNFLSQKQIRPSELINFSKELSLMLNSGLLLLASLQIQAKETQNKFLKQILQKIIADVKRGSSFATSISKQEKYFGTLYVSLIHVGELGGKLPYILNALAKHFSTIQKLKKKMSSIMVYPIFVICSSFSLVIFIILFVFPQFLEMFKEQKKELPFLTSILLTVYNALTNYYLLIFILIILAIIFLRFFMASDYGKKAVIIFLFKIPFINSIYKNYVIINVLKNLSVLIGAGIPIVKSVRTLIDLEKNFVLKIELISLEEKIKSGRSIAEALKGSRFFTGTAISMIAVGEESGHLVEMLESCCEFYQDKFNERTEFFMTLIEPLLIIFVGGIVGVVILAIYLPMFDIINVVN